MTDDDKPWWQRSSFSAAVLVTATLVLAGIRHGWGNIADEQYMGAVAAWLTFTAFSTLSPSARPTAPAQPKAPTP